MGLNAALMLKQLLKKRLIWGTGEKRERVDFSVVSTQTVACLLFVK